jgi:hypothetical protein
MRKYTHGVEACVSAVLLCGPSIVEWRCDRFVRVSKCVLYSWIDVAIFATIKLLIIITCIQCIYPRLHQYEEKCLGIFRSPTASGCLYFILHMLKNPILDDPSNIFKVNSLQIKLVSMQIERSGDILSSG